MWQNINPIKIKGKTILFGDHITDAEYEALHANDRKWFFKVKGYEGPKWYAHESRVIVSGWREYNDYEFITERLVYILSNLRDVEIVEGGAPGVDRLARRFAEEAGLPFQTFEAEWKKYGDPAGPIRNQQMADYGTHCVAFLSPHSKGGTQDMINKALAAGLRTKIIKI